MTSRSPKLSVTIITKNEEHNIRRCLESVKWADEIIVLDTGSEDHTVDICKEYTCNVTTIDWYGFSKSKQMAIDKATSDWILSIDADEEVTPELAKRIESVIVDPNALDGYHINRISFYLTKWIRHSGWDKDSPLRLFRKGKGHFNDKLVHESILVTGRTGHINELLKHYTYPDLTSYIHKMNSYADYWAEDQFRNGKRAQIHDAVFHSISKFLQMYFIKKGFLDGKVGLVLSINSSFSVYLKYLKLWEKHAQG